MSRITHVEIYGGDPGVLAQFYRAVLGWQIEKMEGLAYHRIIAEDGEGPGIGGGITQPPGDGAPGFVPFIAVDAIDAVIAAAEAHGGRVVREKSAVARTAWVAILADPAGNRFAVWQADSSAFPSPEPD